MVTVLDSLGSLMGLAELHPPTSYSSQILAEGGVVLCSLLFLWWWLKLKGGRADPGSMLKG